MPKLSFQSLKPSCWCGAGARRRPPRRIPAAENSPLRISISDFSNSSTPPSPQDLSLSLAGSDLRVFTLEELKAVTGGFSPGNFIGEGGFGPVYKGSLDGNLCPGIRPQTVAVKLLDPEGSQGHREWLAEVIILGQLKHQNLVKLIGYCYEEEHRLLVYEFMPLGSLEKHLFKQVIAPLPWLTRLKIAVGAAKGLAFLHEANAVIYRDFKASNILLDGEYNAKLSDFGLAKDGPQGEDTHVTTRVMGTHGYAAPEYIMTGHLTAKSDVYSFGVVLLELLTGRASMDKNRPSREQNLIEWAKHFLANPHKLDRIMDPSLEDQYSSKGARKAAEITYQCLRHNPKARPDMRAVVETLESLLLLTDIPTVPFVYTVADETTTNDDVEGKSERRAKREMRNRGEAGKGGRRHKIGFSSSPVFHSDAVLYRVYVSRMQRKFATTEKQGRVK